MSLELEFTIGGKPLKDGLNEFKRRLAKALRDGLLNVGEEIQKQAHEIATTGYIRSYVTSQGLTKWPWLSDKTVETYERKYGVVVTPSSHPGLIEPDNFRELVTSLTKDGKDSILRIIEGAGGFPKSVRVGSNVPYADVHEFGGGRIPARPFLAPALYMLGDHGKVVKILSKEVKSVVDKLNAEDKLSE